MVLPSQRRYCGHHVYSEWASAPLKRLHDREHCGNFVEDMAPPCLDVRKLLGRWRELEFGEMRMPQPPTQTRAGNIKGSVGHLPVLALLRDLENRAQGDTCRGGGMEASWYQGGGAMRRNAVRGAGRHGGAVGQTGQSLGNRMTGLHAGKPSASVWQFSGQHAVIRVTREKVHFCHFAVIEALKIALQNALHRVITESTTTPAFQSTTYAVRT
ncbi:hypothetical protein [Roseateles aquatilis]|uniref:hypothetical protein n=1 Tax=Roseateles aquatilis TaxID=431061 RepID=UPI0011327DD2|nr:hypothetical protein [Roseateles aquatilis]